MLKGFLVLYPDACCGGVIQSPKQTMVLFLDMIYRESTLAFPIEMGAYAVIWKRALMGEFVRKIADWQVYKSWFYSLFPGATGCTPRSNQLCAYI